MTNPDEFVIRTPDDLYNEFRSATEQLCKQMGLDLEKIQYEPRMETRGKGLDYVSSQHPPEGDGFEFHIKTFTKNDNIIGNTIEISIDIKNSNRVTLHYLDRKMEKHEWHSNFLQRLVSLAWSEYNDEVLSDKLENLFHDSDIRVYGIPDDPILTLKELGVFLKGMTSVTEKLTMCKFYHVTGSDNYRQVSFAFLASELDTPLWVFFLQVGSPDSGGAKIALDRAYEEIEKVKKKIKVEPKEIHIDFDKLESFLIERSNYFEKGSISKICENSIFDRHYFDESDFGEEFIKNYKTMKKHYKNNEWRLALQEFRPLVQEALKITCDKKGIGIADIRNPGISNLTIRIIQAKILKKTMQKWLDAVANDPNMATHSDFPTEEDLQDENIKNRIFLSFQVGLSVLSELKEIINPFQDEWEQG